MASQENETFKFSSDFSNELANKGKQIIEFYHVPTGHSVNFKAFLTNFEDTFASEWNSENVFGRMDPLMTFQRTGRTISIGFDVVAGSADEAKENLTRASLLMSMLYPSYEGLDGGASTIKNSPYFKLQFLNLAMDVTNNSFSGAEEDGLLGTVSGFSMAPNLDVGFFQAPEDLNLFPKVFNLSCTFTVIHQHPLGWNQKEPAFNNFPYGNIIDAADFGEEFGDYEFSLPKSEVQMNKQNNDELDEALAQTMLAPSGEAGANSLTRSTVKTGSPQPKANTSIDPSSAGVARMQEQFRQAQEKNNQRGIRSRDEQIALSRARAGLGTDTNMFGKPTEEG